MELQGPYGNWAGPPASPASSEPDYDDVSAGSSSPRTGLYLLAGPPCSDPNSRDFPQNSRDFPQNSQDFPPKSQDLNRNIPDFHPNSQDFSRNSQDFHSNSRDFNPNFQDFSRKSQDFSRNSQDFPPNSQDFPLNVLDFPPDSRDFSRNSRDFPPNSGDFPPNIPDFCRNSRDFPRNSRNSRRALPLLGALGGAALLALGIAAYWELRAELELLKSNFSGIWDSAQQDQAQLQLRVQQHQQEQQELSELLCRALGAGGRCGPGWAGLGRSCFSFSRDARGWSGARSACAHLGAHLAVVSSQQEQLFLLQHTERGRSYWLGLSGAGRAGRWRWLTDEEPPFQFWDMWLPEQPEELRDCGALGPKGRWEPRNCSEFHRWICEKPAKC